MKTILIIDTNRQILDAMNDNLRTADFSTLLATDGLEGLQAFYNHHPSLVILETQLPRMDGWTVASRIREVSHTPIIFLTTLQDEADKVRAFSLGADDYVTKPFSYSVMVARVGAILKRANGNGAGRNVVLSAGDIVIDLTARRVLRDGQVVALTPTEFRLLAQLARHRGRPVSNRQLLKTVWGREYLGETHYIKRFVWSLRQKLEADPNAPSHILTEYGYGYCLC